MKSKVFCSIQPLNHEIKLQYKQVQAIGCQKFIPEIDYHVFVRSTWKKVICIKVSIKSSFVFSFLNLTLQ